MEGDGKTTGNTIQQTGGVYGEEDRDEETQEGIELIHSEIKTIEERVKELYEEIGTRCEEQIRTGGRLEELKQAEFHDILLRKPGGLTWVDVVNQLMELFNSNNVNEQLLVQRAMNHLSKLNPDEIAEIRVRKNPTTLEELTRILEKEYGNPAEIEENFIKEIGATGGLQWPPEGHNAEYILETLKKITCILRSTMVIIEFNTRRKGKQQAETFHSQGLMTNKFINTLLGCMDATTTATLTVQLRNKTIAEKFEAIHENFKEKLISTQERIRTYGLGKKGNNPIALMTPTTDMNEGDKKETALAAITEEISKIQHANKLLEEKMGQMMKNDTKPQWQWSTGSCPVCQGNHTYTSKKDQVTRASDRLSNCEVWRKLSKNERADKLTAVKGCKNCTSWKHEYKDCQWKDVYKPCEIPDMNGEACGLKHSIWLHGSNNIQCNVVRTIQQAYNDPRTLLHIVKHVFPNGESTMLFMDNG